MSAEPVAPDARAVLAAAIARRQDAEAHLARCSTAFDLARERWQTAGRAEMQAKAALAAIEEAGEGKWLVAALLAEQPAGPSPKAAAQAAVAEAHADYEAARAAEDALGPEVERGRRAVERAQGRVAVAARAVLAESPAIAVAVERLEDAQAELIAAGDLIAWLVRQDVLLVRSPAPGGSLLSGDGLLARAQHAWLRLERPPQSWRDLAQHAQTTAQWEAALVALETDPDAEIDFEGS